MSIALRNSQTLGLHRCRSNCQPLQEQRPIEQVEWRYRSLQKALRLNVRFRTQSVFHLLVFLQPRGLTGLHPFLDQQPALLDCNRVVEFAGETGQQYPSIRSLPGNPVKTPEYPVTHEIGMN
jgi:hypothetical protein